MTELMYAAGGMVAILFVIAVGVALVMKFARDATGKDLGGRGTYFHRVMERIPGLPTPSDWLKTVSTNAGKLLLGLLMVQFALSYIGYSSWWALVLYIPLIIVLALRESEKHEGMKKAFTVLVWLGFGAVGLYHIPWFRPCNTDCQVARAVEKKKQDALTEVAMQQQALGPKTAECPAGLDALEATGLDKIPVTHTPCLVRVRILKGTCAVLYDRDGDRVGTSCKGRPSTVTGIVYSFSADQEDETVKLEMTYCPFGSRGNNMGSCT